MQGGGIEQEVAQRLRDGQTIVETNFIPLAREVFRTARNPRTDENMALAKQAGEAFVPAEQALSKIVAESGGLAAHLHGGARQMYERVQHYELSDVLSWLDGMQAEIDAYIGRMQSMVSAAASEADVQAAYGALMEAGCAPQPPERLQLGGADAAWVLRATKR